MLLYACLVWYLVHMVTCRQTCNFTNIKPTVKSGMKLTVTINQTGIIVTQYPPKFPIKTQLPGDIVFNSDTKPVVVYKLNILYPDGLNYTLNMYYTGNEFYLSFPLLEADLNGDLSNNCTTHLLPLDKRQEVTFARIAKPLQNGFQKTSYILDFRFRREKLPSSASQFVPASWKILFSFFIATFVVVGA